MTNKQLLRDLVVDLERTRSRFVDVVEIDLDRPIEHCIINFNEAIDTAVESIFGIYSDVMLHEIENEICQEGGES